LNVEFVISSVLQIKGDNRDDYSLAETRRSQRMTENEIGTIIVESAIDTHREFGPGLLETVYEESKI
jgi:hypothetical protein